MSVAHPATHQLSGFRFTSRWTRAADPTLTPILLIGGSLQRKEAWGRLEQALLEQADVITVDLPGWADSDLLPESYPMDTLANAARTLLDDLDLDRVHVAGFSYGSVIAYRLAQLHPERLRRLALVGAASTLPDEVIAASLDAVALGEAGKLDDFADGLLDLFSPHESPARFQAAIRRTVRPAFAAVSPHDVAKFAANARRAAAQRSLHPLPTPRMPVLTVAGEHDTYTTPGLCREVARLCADSWFATVGATDHLLHLQRPREVADLILRFLSGDELSGLPYCPVSQRIQPADPVPAGR
jgi:pimeloyl-ACP methyl ester carboxylesterase